MIFNLSSVTEDPTKCKHHLTLTFVFVCIVAARSGMWVHRYRHIMGPNNSSLDRGNREARLVQLQTGVSEMRVRLEFWQLHRGCLCGLKRGGPGG